MSARTGHRLANAVLVLLAIAVAAGAGTRDARGQVPATPSARAPDPPTQVTLTAAPDRLPLSSTRFQTVYLGLVDAAGRATSASRPVLVRLASSDPTVATLPNTMEIPAGQSALPVPARTFNAGSVTFTAQSPGLTSGQARLEVTTVAADTTAGVLDLAFAPRLFLAGAPGPALLTVAVVRGEGRMPAVATSDLEVRLVSSNPDAIAVPPSVVIRGGAFSVTVPVAVGSEGAASVTALRSGLQSATADTVVHTPGAVPVQLAVEAVPPQTLAGSADGARLVVQAVSDGGVPAELPCGRLELSSAAPAVLAVPDSVSPPCLPGGQSTAIALEPGSEAGRTTITVAAAGLAPGSVEVTASGQTAATLVLELAPAALSYGADSAGWLAVEVEDQSGNPVTVTGDLTVQLSGPAGAAPSEAVVPRGASYVIVPLGRVDLADASAAIEANAPGLTAASVTLTQRAAAGPSSAVTTGGGSDLSVEVAGVRIPLLLLFGLALLALIGLLAFAVLSGRESRGTA